MSEIKQYDTEVRLEAVMGTNHYGVHIHAMTTEDLHSKSGIAVELAWRDLRIEQLITQLEAAHKRIAELDNSESQLINERDHAESTINSMFVAVMSENPEWSNMYQFIDAVDEVEDFVSKLKHRAESAEAELSAANAKPKPISFDELADRVQFVTGGIRMSFDPLNCKGHQIVPFMNFNSLLRIVEMYRTTETYHLAGFTVEGE